MQRGLVVFEQSDRIGSACVTNEIVKGFKVSGAAQVLGMFPSEIIRDLELERHGLSYRLRDLEVFIPFPDGRHLFLYADAERTIARYRAGVGTRCGSISALRLVHD